MATRSIKTSQNLESTAPKKESANASAPSRGRLPSRSAKPNKTPPRPVVSTGAQIAAALTLPPAKVRHEGRTTKQERMLTLLSQPEGASIEEMMQATGWQQHSVRGFLAGALKKKLGFSLTSSKPDDGVRRYRIETRRGR